MREGGGAVECPTICKRSRELTKHGCDAVLLVKRFQTLMRYFEHEELGRKNWYQPDDTASNSPWTRCMRLSEWSIRRKVF
jgi:hypothetical protein